LFYALKREAVVKLAQVGSGRQFLGSFLNASEKRDWDVNENAVKINLTVSYKTDFAFGR